MDLLNLQNISQSYGAFDLYHGVTGNIHTGQKVGLVGPNGIGKTTLLRVIVGIDAPSEGKVITPKNSSIGYLHQDAVNAFAAKDSTLYEELLAVFDPVKEMGEELTELESNLENATAEELEHYGQLQIDFESAGGYDYEQRVKQILNGLGFRPEQYDLPISVLSGGQKTRALLGRILLEKPTFLVLDEPTNHLDVQAIEWLEGILKMWDGAVLIVSHDRYFLDRVVGTIWELSRDGMEIYNGNYTHYVQQREERWDNRQKQFDAAQAHFFKELDYIKKNIARDSTKNMAVGRLKRLVREVKMAQVAGLDAITNINWAEARSQHEISGSKWEVPDVESAIKSMARPSTRPACMNINLKPKGRSGNIVMRTHDLAVGYDRSPLFSVDDSELFRKECVAIIGPNGTGKTTLLKTILGKYEPISGEIELGASLTLGYFAQAHDSLDRDRAVLDEFIEHTQFLIPDARNHLGRYLFHGDDVYKPIRLLSGGERGRLSLAILETQKANYLLLDEPSNHLDIHAQEVLQNSLETFEGTILMVSHDRYLISHIATQIWELQDGKIHVFKGNYQQFLEARSAADTAKKPAPVKKQAKQQVQQEVKQEVQQPVKQEKTVDKPNKPIISKNELRKKQMQLAELEKQIETNDAKIESASQALQAASVSGDFDKIQQASDAFATLEEKVAKLMTAWEELGAEIEEHE